MKILAIEFSSPQRSVAVVSSETVSEVVESSALPGAPISRSARRNAKERADQEIGAPIPSARGASVMRMIEEVLRDAKLEREQIECLVVGLGPGSYTGIRAAIALAQGWQLARDIKLLGISSAEGVIAQAQTEGVKGAVNVVIDAQRNEFYLARYEIGPNGYREVEPLRLASLEEIQRRESGAEVLIGPEVTRWFPSGRIVYPRAATLGKLAVGRNNFVSGEKLAPIYLRETTFVKAPPPRVIL